MSEISATLLPKHGGQLRQIAARYGVSPDCLIDFSANINPAGPPLSVLIAMQQALNHPATLTCLSRSRTEWVEAGHRWQYGYSPGAYLCCERFCAAARCCFAVGQHHAMSSACALFQRVSKDA